MRVPVVCMECGKQYGAKDCEVPSWMDPAKAASHGWCETCWPVVRDRYRKEKEGTDAGSSLPVEPVAASPVRRELEA